MIYIIAAITPHFVIGKNNRVPWNDKEEMALFKRFTIGNTVIMGRKTFQSIGKPLPKRNNIVISKTLSPIPNAINCKSVEEALVKAKFLGKDIFIIGGGEIFKQTLSIADELLLSFMREEMKGDTYFPKFSEKKWTLKETQSFPTFEFRRYAKK